MKPIFKRSISLFAGLQLAIAGTFAQTHADVIKAMDAEQYDKAKTLSKSLIASKPGDADNYYSLGKLYILSENLDSAKTIFQKGVEANGKAAANYVGLGAVALAQKDVAGARSNFDKAISLSDKKDNTTFVEIGDAYLGVAKPDYVAAIDNLNKAILLNPKDAGAYLELGNAYKGQKKFTDAFNAYTKAVELDKSLLRARMALGVLVKQSTAYEESSQEFNKIIAIDPTYPPVYRELAETNYLWANSERKVYDEKIKAALDYYKKYLDLTDKSLDSRMRYADFLILAKDYKTLEQEAQAMSKNQNSNLRIYRYLGYAAFQNGNFPDAVTALTNFITKADSSRIIGSDYFILGQAQVKAGNVKDGLANLEKAVMIDPSNAEVLPDIAKALYTAKQYGDAIQAYNLAVMNPNSKTISYDSFYQGLSNYFEYSDKVKNKRDTLTIGVNLAQADSAFSRVVTLSPTSPDAYLYRARVKRLEDDPANPAGLFVPDYEKYVEIVTAKPEFATDAHLKTSAIEAYSYLGSFYARKPDTAAKAEDYLNKILALDPTNAYATTILKNIKGSK